MFRIMYKGQLPLHVSDVLCSVQEEPGSLEYEGAEIALG